MKRFLLLRIVSAVILAVGVTLVSFIVTNLLPGDPAAASLGQRAIEDKAAVAAFRKTNGLDRPLPVQYATYLIHVAKGDLGRSQQSRRPVLQDLRDYVPATLELAGTASVIAMFIGVSLGTWAALRRDGPVDNALRVVSLGGVSMPLFWLALTSLYLFSFRLRIFPGSGRLDPGMARPTKRTGMYTIDSLLDGNFTSFRNAVGHLLLPSLVLAAYAVGVLTRFTRSSVLEVMGNDYVRAAHAKGLPLRTVMVRHVLRAALVPIITVAGTTFAGMLAGTVLTEKIFGWAGVGQLAYRSAVSLDLPAIMGVSLFVALLYIVINLLLDVAYGLIDPRIRLR